MLFKAMIALVASITSAAADSLPHFSDPLEGRYHQLYKQFRDQVIIQGKCQAYERATEAIRQAARTNPPVHWTAETLAEANKALDACWLDFIAPRS